MIFLTVRLSKVEAIEEHSLRLTNVESAGGMKTKSSKIAKSISNQKAKYRTGIWFFAELTTAIMRRNQIMNKGIEKLKRKFEEDPITVIIVGSLAVTATAKLIDALSAAQGRRAYAQQVNYRTKS